MNDLYLKMLNDIHDQLTDQKNDTKNLINKIDELQDSMSRDVSQLKLSQAKCENKWAISEKLVGLTVGSGSLLGIISWIFSPHNGK